MNNSSEDNKVLAIPVAVLGVVTMMGVVVLFDYLRNGKHKESLHEEVQVMSDGN